MSDCQLTCQIAQLTNAARPGCHTPEQERVCQHLPLTQFAVTDSIFLETVAVSKKVTAIRQVSQGQHLVLLDVLCQLSDAGRQLLSAVVIQGKVEVILLHTLPEV